MRRRSFLGSTLAAAAGFGVLRYATACAPSTPGSPGDAAFRALRERYFLKALELNPVTATYLGGDGYAPSLAGINGRLRDFGPGAIAAELQFYHETRTALNAIAPATLSPQEQVDHAVLGAQLAFLIRQYGDRRYHERCVDTYVAEGLRGVDFQIQQMQDQGNGLLGTEPEWRLVIERVEAIPAYLDTARANLETGRRNDTPPDWRMVLYDGVHGSEANATYFRTTLLATAAPLLGDRPFAGAVKSALQAAAERAADACVAFARYLRDTFQPENAKQRLDRFAAGAEEYQWRVTNCLRVDRSLDELYQYGADQVALYEARIRDVARQVAEQEELHLPFGTEAEQRASLRAVIDHLSLDAPKDDDELFRWYRETGARAVLYGRERELFDIPRNYRLDVLPTPPTLRSTIDAAYYPAPPFKKSGVGRFYLTPTGNDPGALKLNNRASVADTAVHEGFPGHDWHYKYMTQHAAGISNIRWFTPGAVEDSSSMWQDSMATEGWALYAEELMAEPIAGRPHGFYSAAEHLYELQGQLLRAVRVRVDIGIHTGRMTFDEAVDYFAEHALFTPGACAGTTDVERAACEQARRAIYRYSKWPTQAITYNLGKNEILGLREAFRQKRGAGDSARAFHERFMRMGTIPPGYAGTLLLEEEPRERK
ncbi:MAG: DUF885 domain-containing protein [Gemmatimonadota bacterium]